MAVVSLNIRDFSSTIKEMSPEIGSSDGAGFVCAIDRKGGTMNTGVMALSSQIYIPRPEDKKVIPETKRTEANYRSLYSSFFLHGGGRMPTCYFPVFFQMANSLSSLFFRDAIVQYDEALSMIDFYMVLPDGMRLTIGRFVGDDALEDEIDFSIFNKKKLLVSGEMTLDGLLERLKRI